MSGRPEDYTHSGATDDQRGHRQKALLPFHKRLFRAVFDDDKRLELRLIATSVVSPWQRVRSISLQKRRPLLLHLGSGLCPKAGWINIDVIGHKVDLAWNICTQLPFQSNTVDAIFHEHVLEHLSLSQGRSFLQECHRLLKPGAVLRVGVPDLSAYVASYANGGAGLLENVFPGKRSAAAALNVLLYEHGHKAMYDAEALCALCALLGYQAVAVSSYGVSRTGFSCPDTPERARGTLYVEAVATLTP